MSTGKRNIGLFGVSGVLVAVLIIATFVAMGGIFKAQGKGTLTIKIMDKPITLATLNMTIDWVRIQTEEGWTNLTVTTLEPFYFDLLKLTDDSLTLTKDDLPTGNYSEVQLHVLTANASWNDADSGEVVENLTMPSDWIKVFLTPDLQIKSEGEVTVLIDLQPDQNSIAISHSLNIRPVIKAVVEYSADE